ncbi:MAG TPA: VWA domain-containing protein [Candidatus Limnocylindrales bacterium]|nr:VWA domain-containing protein [Candidatus Limnocylindrales bacterium]
MRFRPLGAMFVLATLAAGLALVPAQDSGASGRWQDQKQDQQPIKVGTSLVSLYATVRDSHKKIVANLEQNQFHIYEDGVEQKVAFFSQEKTLPLTMGILIDTSGSEETMIGAIQQAATQFLQRVMQKKDEAMVITFDLDVDLLADWTNDLPQLERAIHRARVNTGGAGGQVTPGPFPTNINGGGTNFYDAVYLACHDKMASEAGRKTLIILTDAEDTGSKLKLQDAIEAAQRADTVVHVLLIAASPNHGFVIGSNGGDMGVARKLTDETGGRAIDVKNEKDLLKAFDEITEELRSEYSLGFYPTNTKLDGTFRHIKVETTDKDYKVVSRKGYYAKHEGD